METQSLSNELEVMKTDLRKTEEQILVYAGEPMTSKICHFSHDELMRLEDMLSQRLWFMNQWFLKQITEEDIKRFEEINGQLLEKTQELYKTTAQTYQKLLESPEIFPPEDTQIEVGLECVCDTLDDVLSDPDEHFGTDLSADVMSIIQQTQDALGLPQFDVVMKSVESGHQPNLTDEQIGILNILDDGDTWAEGWLYQPCFKHICICYAVHAICTHQYFSIPDLLRMKKFNMKTNIRIEKTILC